MVVTNPQQFADHARALASAFGVELVEADAMKPEGAFASQMIPQGPLAALLAEMAGAQEAPRLKGVVVHPIIDETTYAVALHEMGHCVSPTGTMPEKAKLQPTQEEFWRIQMLEETSAWEWARHYALEWTPVMQSVQDWAIGTYERGRDQQMAPRLEAERKAAEQRCGQEAWARRHRVDSPGEFASRIGRNIGFD